MLAVACALIFQLIIYFLVGSYINPTALGQFFLASSLVFIPAAIIEYSFVNSLIHQSEPTELDARAVLGINLSVSIIAIALGLIVSLLIQLLYQYEYVLSYYLQLAIILILISYSSTQNALLKKRLRIKDYSLIDLASNTLYFLLSLSLLLSGYGIQALILGLLVKQLSATVLLIYTQGINSCRPVFSKLAWDKHVNYGKHVFKEKSFGLVLSYADIFLINHFLGAQVVGIYELLKRIILRPLLSGYNAIEQVAFSLLSNSKERPTAYNREYKAFTKLSSLSFLLLALIPWADQLISLVPIAYQQLGQYLPLMVLYATSLILMGPTDIVAYSLGVTESYYRLSLWHGLSVLIMMAIGITLGLEILLIVMIIGNISALVLPYHLILDIKNQVRLRNWYQPFLLWSAMALMAYLGYCFHWPVFSSLCLIFLYLVFLFRRSDNIAYP